MNLLSELQTANRLIESIIKKTNQLKSKSTQVIQENGELIKENDQLIKKNGELYMKIELDKSFYERKMYEMELQQEDKKSINAVFKYTLF